ncbi:hypothetical protein OPT61_g9039 [Boeremia exigua]|uniref:Uncharacterized protein n=1 Tax=Boeremia exigua TaxID=749465 RepID=A0ACC2HW54_9PLEO|nr:hypothetical protein OPT61_g9039 [Boeremia exigua]
MNCLCHLLVLNLSSRPQQDFKRTWFCINLISHISPLPSVALVRESANCGRIAMSTQENMPTGGHPVASYASESDLACSDGPDTLYSNDQEVNSTESHSDLPPASFSGPLRNRVRVDTLLAAAKNNGEDQHANTCAIDGVELAATDGDQIVPAKHSVEDGYLLEFAHLYDALWFQSDEPTGVDHIAALDTTGQDHVKHDQPITLLDDYIPSSPADRYPLVWFGIDPNPFSNEIAAANTTNIAAGGEPANVLDPTPALYPRQPSPGLHDGLALYRGRSWTPRSPTSYLYNDVTRIQRRSGDDGGRRGRDHRRDGSSFSAKGPQAYYLSLSNTGTTYPGFDGAPLTVTAVPLNHRSSSRIANAGSHLDSRASINDPAFNPDHPFLPRIQNGRTWVVVLRDHAVELLVISFCVFLATWVLESGF